MKLGPLTIGAKVLGKCNSGSGSGGTGRNDQEECLSDAEPTENYRPLRLSRTKLRDAFMQA
eukprot:6027089-Amphidinium_carterae.1